MEKGSVKALIKEILWELLGALLVAVGSYNFAIAAELPLTGFTGLAYLANLLTGVPIGWTIIALNIPVAILCYKNLGRRFFFRSLRCMLLTSLAIDYAAPLLPVYGGERLLAALATGVLAGGGYAVIYLRNASTGGSDFITMTIKARNPHIPLGYIGFVMDATVILVIGIVTRDIDGIIYGFVVSFLMSTVADRAIFGTNAGKLALVVTEDGEAISRLIEDTCHRGSTILPAMGGYRGEDKQIVLCACGSKQAVELRRAIREEDPASFLILLESNEVHGDGFRTLEFGDPPEPPKS